jgi:hypothetical protein
MEGGKADHPGYGERHLTGYDMCRPLVYPDHESQRKRRSITMAHTRAIAASDWKSFLPMWSERNQERPVRLEAAAWPDEGMAVLATSSPLLGIDVAAESPEITITVGGMVAQMPEFTHVVREPTQLWVEEVEDGGLPTLEIQSLDGSKTRLVVTSGAACEECIE